MDDSRAVPEKQQVKCNAVLLVSKRLEGESQAAGRALGLKVGLAAHRIKVIPKLYPVLLVLQT